MACANQRKDFLNPLAGSGPSSFGKKPTTPLFFQRSSHGLRIATPAGAKSDSLRVTTLNRRHRAVAAISQYRLAKAIDAPPRRINEIAHGRRSITADTALRIGRALDMTPEYWLNLQKMYDLDRAGASNDLGHIEPLAAAR